MIKSLKCCDIYVDITSIFNDLYIDAQSFLKPIKGRDALPEGSVHAEEELSSVRSAACLFRSALHTVQSYRLKSAWSDASLADWKAIAVREKENLAELLELVHADSRIGYHIEAHAYLFTALDIERKIKYLSSLSNP